MGLHKRMQINEGRISGTNTGTFVLRMRHRMLGMPAATPRGLSPFQEGDPPYA